MPRLSGHFFVSHINNDMKILTPKDDLDNIERGEFTIFLAGGMGSPWRKELIGKLKDLPKLVVIDPSVDDWENEVGEQSANNPKFVKQTAWEHQGLNKSKVQVFYFDDTSIAPISLLELGMFKTNNTVICLKDGYEKGGYVEYMSRRFGLPIEKSVEALSALIHLKYYTLAKVG